MEELSAVTKTVRPFWGRVAVLPSPVDEYERPSGLIVPDHYDGGHDIWRGVVVSVDQSNGAGPAAADVLEPGTVVWYLTGYTVRDLVIVDPQAIVAIEIE